MYYYKQIGGSNHTRVFVIAFLASLIVINFYYYFSKTRKPAREKMSLDLDYFIGTQTSCTMHSCFDYSRCALTSGFPVYFYEPDEHSLLVGAEVDGFLKTSLKQVLGANPHITADPNIACVYVVLIGEAFPIDKTESESINHVDWRFNLRALKTLPYWRGGRNHILLSVSRRELVWPRVVAEDVGEAMRAQSFFFQDKFRHGFDLILPVALGPISGDVWKDYSSIAPVKRQYLLSYIALPAATCGKVAAGFVADAAHKAGGQTGGTAVGTCRRVVWIHHKSFQGFLTPTIGKEGEADKMVVEILTRVATEMKNESINIELQWQCDSEYFAPSGEWALCGTEQTRQTLLSRSTFALLPATRADSSALLLARLYEAIRAAAIPLLLVTHNTHLPFDEVIDWDRAVLTVPAARAAELPLLMRSIPDADLLQMRRQGRNILERYMSSLKASIDTLLSVVRTRLRIPPPPARLVPAPPSFNGSHTPPGQKSPTKNTTAFPNSFTRNFSLQFANQYSMWNEWFSPWWQFPQLPWDPAVTMEARFMGSGDHFQPVTTYNTNITDSLGGDRAQEQFTIVILTYKRQKILATTLTRLKHLPYLNKIVVVWNDPASPTTMKWPKSGAPIAVVRAAKNSLNNRFLPYDVIETEAVLCLDDDTHLDNEVISFAFRVWRQHRDQIVGIPGRQPLWDNTINGFRYCYYKSCELSMVLTGAAFVHRYYMFAYWTQLPQAVRDLVDEHVNCEDIAMNFLVAHITRKPPVKVTQIWTPSCPECTVSLSKDTTHINKRSHCLQFFTKVMGYTPLQPTQYAAVPVLNTCFNFKIGNTSRSRKPGVKFDK